ncbi:unnamed protein product [marine sediment metagenome]|uniref:Uncharacterized protein n=1 Tax=marine sediment metagenome TaxID=412755 RepID=X1G8L1_9ZZZZ
MEGIITEFSTAIEGVKNDTIAMFAVVLPYALVLFGIIVVVSIAILLFKKVSGGEKS